MRRDRRRGGAGRDEGGFIALPWAVVDSDAYQRLSDAARSLLMEIARQYVRDNNGRLLASRRYLHTRGWKSADKLQRAKRELLAAGFIFETVMGQRPNKASWYALTWYALDPIDGYDEGARESFQRSAYKNAPLNPSHGTERPLIVPPHGTETARTVPPHGTMRATFAPATVPPDGHHLDKPSTAAPIPRPALTAKLRAAPKRHRLHEGLPA